MIPKKLHLVCQHKYNDKYYINRFAKLYADYEIILYDDAAIYAIICEYFPHHLDVKIKPILKYIFRYLILYLEGGIYADIDCNPLKNIGDLFKHKHYHGDYRGGDNSGNVCKNCALTEGGDIQTYKCLGHLYANNEVETIVSYEIYPNQICKWFIITSPRQQIFLDCYRQSIINMNYNEFTKIIFTNISNKICILPPTFFGGFKTVYSYIEK